MNKLFDFDSPQYKRRVKEGEKQVFSFFTKRIKESFLKEMKFRVMNRHPDFICLFNINLDFAQNYTGNQDFYYEYEILRNIVGIHRSNTIGKTTKERVEMEKSEEYRNNLADTVYEHLKLRGFTSVFFRRRQFIDGDEFIFFPVPYKLFAICIRGLGLLQSYDGPFKNLYVHIFNKAMAALVLIEDNLLDSAFPICRGIIELYIKFIILIDHQNVLNFHNKLVMLEIQKTANCGENPEELDELFANRKNKRSRNYVEFLHYGWVDEIEDYHNIIKNKPYSFNSLFDYIKEKAPEKAKDSFDTLQVLFNRCHGFAHGNIGNSGYPLLYYMELSMILYFVLVHVFRLLCDDTGSDYILGGINIVESILKDGDKLLDQYSNRNQEMFDTFYNPKGQ